MGHHFLPQRYLRNFECPGRPGFIWQHDKQTGDAVEVAIKQAAQSRKYYEEHVERQLADLVERPANPIIAKLIEGRPISPPERTQLSVYIATMLMRVPANRRRQREDYPTAVAAYYGEVRRELAELPATLPIATPEVRATISARLDILEAVHRDSPPPEMLTEIQSPFPYRNMVEAVESMTWRILVATGPQFFITSDDPGFRFEDLGLSNKASELTLSLSTTHALHGSWQDAESLLVYVPLQERRVHDINRRLASGVERFAFYHEKAPWLLRVLAKGRRPVPPIRWSESPHLREPPPGALVADGTRYPLGPDATGSAEDTQT